MLGLYGVLWGKNREMRSSINVEEELGKGEEKATTPIYDLESLS